MATSVKMSSKHQIVVPKEAREALGLEAGDRLVVTVREDGVLEMEREPEDLVEELGGLLAGEAAGTGAAPAPAVGSGPAAERAAAGLWTELLDG
ncbi:MAG TPA: AbrB/MazE/SpoVT family DNA-binding domain-containing protein [Gemmatimonadota bacterium]|nr:AbrB/MazE/SpoVT family DNA-binding domain-containing protein [Gemmatimonadota bacterium]